jgi:hypothetical protein
MMDKQRELRLGEALRDEGIERAAAHAEKVSEGWRELAAVLLHEYARVTPKFTAEQASAYAFSRGLPKPPDGRAYGSVIARGRRANLIVLDGYEKSPNPKHHRDTATRWKSKVYRT